MKIKNQSTVLEQTEFIIIGEMTHKDHGQLKKVLILIIFLIISLTALHFNKFLSYDKYERVQFQSAGATLYANLYYPTRTLNFQEKRPLVIYCHGIGSKRDFDLRIPIEFTKRGFYVAALDYQGHGESNGNINNMDPITGIPALAQDCSKLLDKLETLPFYSKVDTSQIGLIGHSLGGMVVLMNQALDPRFNVTVALAPLVNLIPPRFGFVYNEDFMSYIPANLLNKENTHNLLIIMHVDDEILDFTDNALRAFELTGCTFIPMTGFMIGGAHQLYSDKVLIESINWFELHFFKSETINGPIIITFYWNYVLIFINIGLLFIIIIYLISISSKLFFKKEKEQMEVVSYQNDDQLYTSSKKTQILKIISYTGAFLLNWVAFERLFGIVGILYASLNMIFIYMIIKLINHFKKLRNQRFKRDFMRTIKSQLKLKYLIYIIICTAYFSAIYMMFTFYYPFAFIWPSNFVVHFTLGYLAFPVFLSMEILLRKVIYPQLRFLKSESSKSKITVTLSIIILISLMFFTRRLSYFPSLLFMYLIFLTVIIQNTKIFENVKCFYLVVIISFSMIQIFFAAVLSNAIGISFTL